MKRIVFYTLTATLSIISVGLFFFSPSPAALAKVGVGMGAKEIQLTEDVKPGGIYTLPSLRIFNTGDEETTYGMGTAYHQSHEELRPAKEWFTFNPATFTLNPEESQEVQITMTVPLEAEPGDYFAFLESGPVAENKPGTSVGVAVASRLFFTVIPATMWQGILWRTTSLFEQYAPGSYIALGIIAFMILILILRRFISFRVHIKPKG